MRRYEVHLQGVTQEPRTPSPIRSRVIGESNAQVSQPFEVVEWEKELIHNQDSAKVGQF